MGNGTKIWVQFDMRAQYKDQNCLTVRAREVMKMNEALRPARKHNC